MEDPNRENSRLMSLKQKLDQMLEPNKAQMILKMGPRKQALPNKGVDPRQGEQAG